MQVPNSDIPDGWFHTKTKKFIDDEALAQQKWKA